MNLNKASKVESSYMSRDPIGRFHDSFAASSSSGSKKNSLPRENKIKNSLAQFSNKRLNAIADGSKALKSNFSCKRILSSSGATKSSSLNQNEVKTSAVNSLNTSKLWNAYCRRLVSSFGGSKSKPSNLKQASLFKKNETKSPVEEGSSKVKHDCKNDLRALMNRSLVASPNKLGSPCSNNKERRSNVVCESGRSQPSRLNKVQPVTVMKKQIQINATPKDPPNLRKKVPKSEVSKDSPVATKKEEIHKTESSKASMTVSPKKRIIKADDQKDSPVAIQKRETLKKTPGLKIPAAPIKKIGTGKTSTLLSSDDKKNHPSSSHHYKPYSSIPVYHIKWDGHDKESERSGDNCILCNKNFSCSAQDDYGSHEDDEYKYRIEFRPQLLPCVDVLPCGHAFHSECLRYVIPEKQSTNPLCVLCLSMA